MSYDLKLRARSVEATFLAAVWACGEGAVLSGRPAAYLWGLIKGPPPRPEITKKLEKLVEPPGFTGNAPGGPSRWSTERSTEWQPLKPKLVVEVEYDHFTGDRFRHGTKFLRWRPDKAPRQCKMEQVAQAGAASLKLLKTASA